MAFDTARRVGVSATGRSQTVVLIKGCTILGKRILPLERSMIPFDFTCDCDIRNRGYYRAEGPLSFLSCSKCERRQPIGGEIVAAFRQSEYTGAWEALPIQPTAVCK